MASTAPHFELANNALPNQRLSSDVEMREARPHFMPLSVNSASSSPAAIPPTTPVDGSHAVVSSAPLNSPHQIRARSNEQLPTPGQPQNPLSSLQQPPASLLAHQSQLPQIHHFAKQPPFATVSRPLLSLPPNQHAPAQSHVRLPMKFDNFFGQASTSVVRRLGWKQGDEEESWSKKAIDSLVKKLQKHNKEALEMLDKALKAEGREPSGCVTIPRSLDGRLQISHRKALPHVIYCRVYRWPDLQSHHELKAIESGQKDICINPYHYERVDSACVLPPVLVPRYSEPPPIEANARNSQIQTQRQIPPFNVDMSNGDNPAEIQRIHQSQQAEPSQRNPNYGPMQPAQFPNNVINRVPVPFVPCKHWATISYYELNNRVGEQIRVSSNTVHIDGFTDPNTQDKISLGLFSNINRNTTIENTRRHIGKGVKLTYVPYQGTLYAECLSESAVFIQSRNCNYINNFHPTTVVKITNGYSLKIFDTGRFGEWLDRALAKLGPSPDPISSMS